MEEPQPQSSRPLEPTMTEEEIQTHISFMREAIAMATLALNTSETPVGCVLVHGNSIIGRGMNATNRTYNGTRHAEFIALNDVLTSVDEHQNGKKRYDPSLLKECVLYVTVEPCIMCASLLRQVGIKKVYFGASNEKFGGTGGVLNVQWGNGREGEGGIEGEREKEKERVEGDYEISGGWLREEAILLLRRFYVQENDRAPEPRGKKERVLNLEVAPLGGNRA